MEGLFTSRQKCFSYDELKNIGVEENGEPLVNLREVLKNVRCGPAPKKMIPYVGDGLYVRQSVAKLLDDAAAHLGEQNPSRALLVRYAYRHPEIQKASFETFLEKAREQNRNMSEEDLYEYAHHYMAIPGVGGHPVGGAVDITIVEGDVEVDMGSAMADFTDMEKVPTFSKTISEEALKNRLQLREVMMKAGFAPYDFEWWHFSYGDREWACYYQKAFALYGEVDFRNT